MSGSDASDDSETVSGDGSSGTEEESVLYSSTEPELTTTTGETTDSRQTTATSETDLKSLVIRTTDAKLLPKDAEQEPPTTGEIEANPLTNDVIVNGLSELRRSLVNGKHTYSRLNVSSKHIADVEILCSYVHLRFVDLSRNFIRDLTPLASLEYLEVLDASGNCIDSPACVPVSKHLKHLYLRKNKLSSVMGFAPNSLVHLDLRDNQVSSVEGLTDEVFATLSVLELRGNCLTALKGINLKNLEKLYAADNKITTIGGLSNCPNLQVLHLRGNKIVRLRDFPDLARLEYVNLRENNIRRFTETAYLMHAPNIRTLVLTDNAICQSYRYRTEMAVAVPLLRRLDKANIDTTELEEGRRIFCGRMKGKIAPVMDDPAVLTPPETPEKRNMAEHNQGGISARSPNQHVGTAKRNNEEEDDDERLVPPNTPTPPASHVVTPYNGYHNFFESDAEPAEADCDNLYCNALASKGPAGDVGNDDELTCS